MPLPLLLANPLVQQGLLALGGGIAGRIFGKKKPAPIEAPDLIEPTTAVINRRRGSLADSLRFRQDDLSADLAAAGATGSAGVSARDALFRSNNDARSQLDSAATDIMTEAINRQKLLDFQVANAQRQEDLQQFMQRGQGIAGIFDTLGATLSNQQLLKGLQGGQGTGGALPDSITGFQVPQLGGPAGVGGAQLPIGPQFSLNGPLRTLENRPAAFGPSFNPFQ